MPRCFDVAIDMHFTVHFFSPARVWLFSQWKFAHRLQFNIRVGLDVRKFILHFHSIIRSLDWPLPRDSMSYHDDANIAHNQWFNQWWWKCNVRPRINFIAVSFVRYCVFGRRKWKLLQIMASASNWHEQKNQCAGFQVNGYNTLSIISVRQTVLNAKLNGFSGYFAVNEKCAPMQKKGDRPNAKEWTPFEFICNAFHLQPIRSLYASAEMHAMKWIERMVNKKKNEK